MFVFGYLISKQKIEIYIIQNFQEFDGANMMSVKLRSTYHKTI